MYKKEISELYDLYGHSWKLFKKQLKSILGKKFEAKEIYDILFEGRDVAPCGKIKKFKRFDVGYTFSCIGECQCRTDAQLEKTRQTNLDRYGVENVRQAEGIGEKIRETVLDRYGVENVMHLPEVRSRLQQTNVDRCGYVYPKQKHISKDSLVILQDKNKIQDIFKGRSLNAVSDYLGITRTTFGRYWNKHDLPSLGNISSYELEINHFLKSLNVDFETNNKSILGGLQLDFFIPDRKLAIEFNGLFHHSTAMKKDKKYHRNKFLGCKAAGIRLLMINQDEWDERNEVVKSRIKNILKMSERGLGARKLRIDRLGVGEANMFFNRYHIHGNTGSIIYSAGAWDGDALVGAMAFNKQRITQDIELIRYATDEKSYAGLFSRLFKYSINHEKYTKVISFADLRYSLGEVYEQNGFNLYSEIAEDYRYLWKSKTWHKSNFTKRKISKRFGLDMSTLSEKEAMKMLKIPRIYDCGKLKYVWTSPSIK